MLDIKEGKLCVVSKLVCNDIPNKMLHYVVEDQDYVAIGTHRTTRPALYSLADYQVTTWGTSRSILLLTSQQLVASQHLHVLRTQIR